MGRRLAALCLSSILFLSGCTMLAMDEEPPDATEPPDGTAVLSLDDTGGPVILDAGAEWNISGSVNGSMPTKTVISLEMDDSTVLRVVPAANGEWMFNTTAPGTVGEHLFTITAIPAHGNVTTVSGSITVVLADQPAPVLVVPLNHTVEVGGILQVAGRVEHDDLTSCVAVWSPDIGSERQLSVDDESGAFRLTLVAPAASYDSLITVRCGVVITKTASQLISIELVGADAVDSDGDGVLDSVDGCPESLIEFTSGLDTDHDADGCHDDNEDSDDDADGRPDIDDACPTGVIGWNSSNTSDDLDSDGCRDSDEDADDDGDGIPDVADSCPQGASFSSSAVSDHDADGCRDHDEDTDDDDDGVPDVADACPIGSLQWGPSTEQNDFDGDGCSDADEDDDDDGDGVTDGLDVCASTGPGLPVNEFGCSSFQWDEDADGIFDHWDECLGTPAGLSVNTAGCADLDGDGIFANVDDCPDSQPRWTADLNGCTALQRPVAWSMGPYGTTPFDTAGPWTIQTQNGSLRFQDHWDGEHTYLFIFNQKSNSYSNGVWSQNVGTLLESMPDDVHVFFGSFDSDWSSDMAAMDSRIQSWLQGQTEEIESGWQGRIHLVQQRAGDASGSIDDVIDDWSSFYYGIDRFQRWRQTGSLHDWSQGGSCCTKGYFLANEPRMWAAEFPVEMRSSDPGVTVVEAWSGEQHQGGWSGGYSSSAITALPNASAMASFNTLEVYLEHACDGRRNRYGIDDDGDGSADRYGGCHEWDYLHYLKLCDADDNGSCEAELVRYITTYGREGRWLTDVSPLLWMLQEGGNRTLQYKGANGGFLTVRLLLSTWDDDGLRPVAGELAFEGGRFNDQYNNGTKYVRSHEVNVSQQWSKVEIVASITGHGFGEVAENCAEFCNHEHRWTMNGHDVTEDHPMAGNSSVGSDRMGCQKLVDDGVVANQMGSWPYGRAGWCPGLDVELFIHDITDWINPTGSNTLTYRGLYDGIEYTRTSSNPNIVASIWLVYHTNFSNGSNGSFEMIDMGSVERAEAADDGSSESGQAIQSTSVVHSTEAPGPGQVRTVTPTEQRHLAVVEDDELE